MKVKSYRDLETWQQAMAFVMEVYRVTKLFPKEELFGLTSQVRRAAVSIPSNIAEGQGRDSTKEFRFFGNSCPSLPYLVVILCESGGAIQIKPNAAEETADVGQAVTASFEYLDFIVQAFDPAAR